MSVTQDFNILPEADTDPYDLTVPQNALAMSARINRVLHVDRFQRQQFEREWFRNVLFYVGQQWIIYDRGKWRPKNLPTWFPRAMTNKFAEKINDFVTTLIQNGRTPINYLPVREDEPDDKAICEIATDVREVMYDEAGIDDEAPTLAAWVGLTGNGFLLPYYDYDEKWGMAEVPMQECVACSALQGAGAGIAGLNQQTPEGARANITGVPPTPQGIPPETGNGARPVSDVGEDGDQNLITKAVQMIASRVTSSNPSETSPPNPNSPGASATATSPVNGQPLYSPKDIVDNQGTCPVCGGSQFQPALDENGNPITQKFPRGKFCTDVCAPFEIRLDHRITKFSKQKEFVRMEMMDLDEAKQEYKDLAPYITADHENDLGQFYLNALAHVTSAFGISGGFVGGASNPLGPKTVRYTLYKLPDENYPEGLKCVRIGANSDLIVEAGPLPSEYGAGPNKGKKFLPLVKFGFDRVAGRLWSKTRGDDVVPLQLFHNIVEAALRLTAQRMGNPVWLDPKGSGVEILTGEPGQSIKYNPVSVGGTSFAKPERIPAELSNVMPFIALMNKIEDSIERVMGTFFLQGGECVGPDTECLTRKGWAGHDRLRVGDEIYSIDPITQRGTWTRVNRIYRNPIYSGPVSKINSQTISGMFTPRHDFLVGNADGYEYKANGRGRSRKRHAGLQKLHIEDLKTHHFIPAQFPLGEQVTEKFSDDFVSLVGWVVTDGYYDRERHRVTVCQSRTANPEKLTEIRGLFDRLDYAHFESNRANGMNELSFYKGDAFIEQFPDKRLTPEFISALSLRQLHILIEAMMKGDGHSSYHDGRRKHYSRRFSSTDPILADQFQMIASLAGYTTHRSRRVLDQDPRPEGSRYTNFEYRVSLKSTKRISWLRVKPHIQEEMYSGMVWCPNTGTGNWLARHDGRTFITGNTPPGVTAACLDESTECLTKRGWKKHNEIRPDDLLYSVNQSTGDGEWTKLKTLHVFPDYAGPVYTLEGRELSFIATPNHAWPVRTNSHGKLSKFKRRETQELKSHDIIPAGARLLGGSSVRSLDEVRLAAWIFAEGHFVPPSGKKGTKHWAVVITQSHRVNAEKCDQIRFVLNSLGIGFREYKQGTTGRTQFYIYGIQADSLVAKYPNKRPSVEWVTSLTAKEADAFCSVLISGDGHRRKFTALRKNEKNPPREELFTNSDPFLVDMFQIAATILGRNSSRNEEIDGNKRPHQSDRSSDSMFTVSLKQMKKVQIGALVQKKAKLVDYRGLMWCPETESGTWVARRTGKVMLTCNSALAYL